MPSLADKGAYGGDRILVSLGEEARPPNLRTSTPSSPRTIRPSLYVRAGQAVQLEPLLQAKALLLHQPPQTDSCPSLREALGLATQRERCPGGVLMRGDAAPRGRATARQEHKTCRRPIRRAMHLAGACGHIASRGLPASQTACGGAVPIPPYRARIVGSGAPLGIAVVAFDSSLHGLATWSKPLAIGRNRVGLSWTSAVRAGSGSLRREAPHQSG
jgi:hypothetical protein